jgi:small subunit ribosomal protein S18
VRRPVIDLPHFLPFFYLCPTHLWFFNFFFRKLETFSVDTSAMLQSKATSSDISSQVGLELSHNPVDDEGSTSRLQDPGIQADYCIFCYHGVGMLRHDNTELLSKLVSERGAILSKRFTKCCPKHQRAVATTIKRSRSLALIPFHAKLHPMARFQSFSPPAPLARREALSHHLEQRAAAFSGSMGGKGSGETSLIKELSK